MSEGISELTCLVYWIHLPEHTDIFSQGYVGITTNDLEQRWLQHKSAAKHGNFIISKALRKYGDRLVCDKVLVSTLDYCLDIEFKLRPNPATGWNLAVGGKHTNNRHGFAVEEETRQKISQSLKRYYSEPENLEKVQKLNLGRKHSEETKRKMSESRKSQQPWQNSLAIKELWLMAPEFYNYLVANPKHGVRRMANYFDIPWFKIETLHTKLKSGWNPNNCPHWQDFFQKNITTGIK